MRKQVDEALELQTYQAALKGNRMAVRAVLKMIEKREVALRKIAPGPMAKPKPFTLEYDSNSADAAMELLNITCRNSEYVNGDGPRQFRVEPGPRRQRSVGRGGRSSKTASVTTLTCSSRIIPSCAGRGGRPDERAR